MKIKTHKELRFYKPNRDACYKNSIRVNIDILLTILNLIISSPITNITPHTFIQLKSTRDRVTYFHLNLSVVHALYSSKIA